MRRILAFSIFALFTGFMILGPSQATAAERDTEKAFPYVIHRELGTSGFVEGDRIVISEVRSDRPRLEPGGTYWVTGSYTLASTNRATLALSLTSKGPSGPSAWADSQHRKIEAGSGKFSLKETMPYEGYFHVSFYVEGERHSHGGVYFGEAGQEKTILRTSDWSVVTGKKK